MYVRQLVILISFHFGLFDARDPKVSKHFFSAESLSLPYHSTNLDLFGYLGDVKMS